MTFSAAGNFAADVDRGTRARLFGEPTGGAPSHWGDDDEAPFQALTRRFGFLYAEAVVRWADEAEQELERPAPRQALVEER